jgi:hypothetical protein
MAECTQNNCGRRCFLSAVLAQKSPFLVRQMVFSWQSDIPSYNFWRPSRVSKLGKFCDFKQIFRLAPPDRIPPYQSLCCYLTHRQSFPDVSHHQIMISIADNWDIKHVTSPVSQYAINLNMNLSIRRDPRAFLNVSMVCFWESHLSMWQKVSIVTALSLLLLSLKLSFITLGFKLYPLSSFELHSSKGILVWHSEIDQIPVPNVHINWRFITCFALTRHTGHH